MKIIDILKKNGFPQACDESQALYKHLASRIHKNNYYVEDAREGMSVVNVDIIGWWKPRFLMDNKAMRAYEFLTPGENFCTVTPDDVDWDSLKGLSEECLERAHDLNAHFPTIIGWYKNGVAEVRWQLNPDGRYYMDEDGFGMTNDVEVEIYGFIDRQGKVLAKFCHVNKNWDLLEMMRQEAESKVANQ